MALCSLLTYPTNARGAQGFIFDHDQEHRAMFDSITHNGATPSLLDPAPIKATLPRTGSWHYSHQTGHDQFSLAQTRHRAQQNLADSTFADKLSLSWWTFANQQEHFLSNRLR